MRFSFTDDQRMLRDTVREVLQRECPPEAVRAVWEGDRAAVDSVWSTLAETGAIAIALPDDRGGMGLTEIDSVLLFEELGYAAYPGPIVDTMAVGLPLLAEAGTDAQKDLWLDLLAAGQAKVVVSFEGEPFVADASYADLLLAYQEGGLYCVPITEVTLTAERSVDRARTLSQVSFDRGTAEPMRQDVDQAACLGRAERRATLATAAQLVGLSRRMLDMTVQYAKDREQFGKPIGAQQAVKHRLADALIQQEFARPMAYRAAWSMATEQPSAEVDVSVAKIYAADAARFVAKQALQVHGAIGYTIEYDLHMWMKRAWALAAAHGDPAFHRARVGRHIL